MHSLSRKKLLAIGFLLILLIAIPVTIFFIKQQQKTTTKAAAATTLEFEPTSTANAPIQIEKDKQLSLDVFVDPGAGTNLVNYINMEVDYDPNKFRAGGATASDKSFTENSAVVTVQEGPVDTIAGKISVVLVTGADPTKAIQLRTKIGTILLTSIDGTGSEASTIGFNPGAIITSSGGVGDLGAAENVFNGGTSAFVSIAGAVTNSSTPSTAPSSSPTPSTTTTPSPTAGAAISPTTTTTPSPSLNPVPSATPSGGSGASASNIAPVCSVLEVDRTTTGTAPYAITFTAKGTDSDGTISKVTFSYGDGQVENVTTAGGIGTNTVASSIAHTYQNSGTFSASAVLTDNSGGVSSGTCTQTITVNAAVAGASSGSISTGSTSNPSMPATGPGETFLAIGAIITALSAIGGVLFFIL